MDNTLQRDRDPVSSEVTSRAQSPLEAETQESLGSRSNQNANGQAPACMVTRAREWVEAIRARRRARDTNHQPPAEVESHEVGVPQHETQRPAGEEAVSGISRTRQWAAAIRERRQVREAEREAQEEAAIGDGYLDYHQALVLNEASELSDRWDHVKWLRRAGFTAISFIAEEAGGFIERDMDGFTMKSIADGEDDPNELIILDNTSLMRYISPQYLGLLYIAVAQRWQLVPSAWPMLVRRGAISPQFINRHRWTPLATIVTGMGFIASRPCNRCVEGRGPFLYCTHLGFVRGGACNNCIAMEWEEGCERFGDLRKAIHEPHLADLKLLREDFLAWLVAQRKRRNSEGVRHREIWDVEGDAMGSEGD